MIRRTFLSLLLLCALAPLALAQDQSASDLESFLTNGRLYFAQGNCELAQYFYQEALKVSTDNVEALVGKGKALACRNNFARAIEEFQRAIEVDDGSVSAYVQLALAYERQYFSDRDRFPNRLGEALDTIETAERIAPENAEVQNTKGVILYEVGDLDGAQAALERAVALAIAPNATATRREQAVYQINLGKVYRDLDELELALQAFRRSVVLDPTSADAHNNLGNIHFRLGNCDEAEYELSQAAALAPQNLSAVSQLAIALFECDAVEQSIPRFEQAIEIDGSVFLPSLFTYVARGYLQQGRFDEAVRRAQQGALLPPESAEAFYWLGRAYQGRGRSGDVEAARRAYQRALELDEGYQPAREALDSLN